MKATVATKPPCEVFVIHRLGRLLCQYTMGCGKSSLVTEGRVEEMDAIPALGNNEQKYQLVDEGQGVLTDNVTGSTLDKQQLPLVMRTMSTVKANNADIIDHRLGTREMKFRTDSVLDKSEVTPVRSGHK